MESRKAARSKAVASPPWRGSFNSHSNIFVRFLSCVFSFHVGAETEEAAPVPQQPVAVMAEVAAAPPQPTTDSLLGDLLDMGPSQPVYEEKTRRRPPALKKVKPLSKSSC